MSHSLTLCNAVMQQYITSIGALLPEAEAQPKSAAAQRAEQLGREAMYIGSCLAAGVPRHVRTLHCLKLHEGGPEHSRAPPQLWTAITFQMSLSAEQRQVRALALPAFMEVLRYRASAWEVSKQDTQLCSIGEC